MWKQTTRKQVPPRRRSARIWLTGGLLLAFIVIAGLLVMVGGMILGRVRSR